MCDNIKWNLHFRVTNKIAHWCDRVLIEARDIFDPEWLEEVRGAVPHISLVRFRSSREKAVIVLDSLKSLSLKRSASLYAHLGTIEIIGNAPDVYLSVRVERTSQLNQLRAKSIGMINDTGGCLCSFGASPFHLTLGRIKSDLKEFPNRLIESIWQSSLELAERPLISGLSLNQAGRFGQCFPDRDLA